MCLRRPSQLNGLNVACIYSNLPKLSFHAVFIILSTVSFVVWSVLNKVMNIKAMYEIFIFKIVTIASMVMVLNFEVVWNLIFFHSPCSFCIHSSIKSRSISNPMPHILTSGFLKLLLPAGLYLLLEEESVLVRNVAGFLISRIGFESCPKTVEQ
jgi:hypothetical protein